MSLTDSSYLMLVRLKARHQIQKDPRGTILELERRISKKKSKVKQLKEIYSFDPKNHAAFFNKSSAPRSNGCGCAYCVALHNYARLKLEKHYFKATFYKDTNIRYGDPNYNRYLLVDFDIAYASYVKECKRSNIHVPAEQEFYEKKILEYDKQIKDLRIKYKSIKDAIDAIQAG